MKEPFFLCAATLFTFLSNVLGLSYDFASEDTAEKYVCNVPHVPLEDSICLVQLLRLVSSKVYYQVATLVFLFLFFFLS